MEPTFAKYCDSNGIKQIFTTTYHPQTNGMVERINKTIKEKLSIAILEKSNLKWSSSLKPIINQYNSTIHDTTGYTPKFLLFGIQDGHTSITGTFGLDTARKDASNRTRIRQEQNKVQYDKYHKTLSFIPNEKVLVILPHNHPSRNKLSPRSLGTFVVIAQTSPVNYLIGNDMNDSKPIHVHVSRLVKYNQRDETNSGNGE